MKDEKDMCFPKSIESCLGEKSKTVDYQTSFSTVTSTSFPPHSWTKDLDSSSSLKKSDLETEGRQSMASLQRKRKPNEYKVKAILLGDTGVGKSTFLECFRTEKFSPQAPGHRPRCDVVHRNFFHKDDIVDLQLQDTAGLERYRSLTASYYRNAHCSLVVFNVNQPQSFKNVENWLKDISTYRNFYEVTTALVGLLHSPCRRSKVQFYSNPSALELSPNGLKTDRKIRNSNSASLEHVPVNCEDEDFDDLDIDCRKAVPRPQAEHLASEWAIPYYEIDLQNDPKSALKVMGHLIDMVMPKFTQRQSPVPLIKPDSKLTSLLQDKSCRKISCSCPIN